MANHRNRFPARRRFLKQSTALTVVALPLPRLAGARAGEKNDEAAKPLTGAARTQGQRRRRDHKA